MEKLESAANAVNKAIDAIKAIGESKRTNAMVRKLTFVKADIEGELAKRRVMGEIPVTSRRKVD